jgi:galactosamine-6-phosphate isomerase
MMEIIKTTDYDELSELASEIIINSVKEKPDLLLCTATGNSPKGTYIKVTEKRDTFSSERLRIVKLDEWGGIPMNDPESCEVFLRRYLIEPLNIPDSRFISFKTNPANPEDECRRIQQLLDTNGHPDLSVLGIGMNGHLALNEPSDNLIPSCHIAELSPTTLNHPMALNMKKKPTYGLTLGIRDIILSKRILLLISGASKKSITARFLEGKITTDVPASLLWLHPFTTCIIESDAL